MTDRVCIATEYIKLDSLLKLSGIAQTGGHAKILIAEGEVSVNGVAETRRGRKIRPGDIVEYDGTKIEVAADGES